jgi:hypothetical protein
MIGRGQLRAMLQWKGNPGLPPGGNPVPSSLLLITAEYMNDWARAKAMFISAVV